MLVEVDALSTGARRTKSEAAVCGERRYVRVARTTRRWRGGVEVKLDNRLLARSERPVGLCFTADVYSPYIHTVLQYMQRSGSLW